MRDHETPANPAAPAAKPPLESDIGVGYEPPFEQGRAIGLSLISCVIVLWIMGTVFSLTFTVIYLIAGEFFLGWSLFLPAIRRDRWRYWLHHYLRVMIWPLLWLLIVTGVASRCKTIPPELYCGKPFNERKSMDDVVQDELDRNKKDPQ